MRNLALTILAFLLASSPIISHALPPAPNAPIPVILDTDIGDDIDDAYALALLLNSPEVKILGITTAFGDTHLRARLVSRLLAETGHQSIPVFEGPRTIAKNGLSQSAWASAAPDETYPDAIDFILNSVRKNPGKITLISIAPMTNVGAAIKKDAATFRELKRIVLMGGSIHRGYGDLSGGHPSTEWNIVCDIPAAQALFKSGIPLYVMPLDSTQIKFDSDRQKILFAQNDALTNALHELTKEWSVATKQTDPTLYDPVAAAYTIRPDLCPTTPMHIEVDEKGMTREISGKPNANVCLTSSPKAFFNFFMPRVLQ